MAPRNKGLRVLATRPRAQNHGWCELLKQAGLPSLAVPVLQIDAVQEPQQRQAIKNLILNFDQFDKILFVSQNAVREALIWLDEFWPQLPHGMQYFAVGQKTAQLLHDNGIATHSCSQAMDSDELLSMPQLQQVAGQKVLLCRGRGGRPRLAEVLQARGAQVIYGEFYQRVLPPAATGSLRHSDFARAGYREILSAFSGESLANLVAVLATAEVENWHELPLLIPGERVARQARREGFQQIIIAANATDEAMLGALQNALGCQP